MNFIKKIGTSMTQCLVHFFSDGFNDIHELKYGQAEEKLEAGGDEKLIFNFIWPNGKFYKLDNRRGYYC